MNFISRTERPEVPVELKYCERCGGLWLRDRGKAEVYCTTCLDHLANVMSGLRRMRWEGRKPMPVRLEYLEGVAQAEVRA